jgi:hypothetical protein
MPVNNARVFPVLDLRRGDWMTVFPISYRSRLQLVCRKDDFTDDVTLGEAFV